MSEGDHRWVLPASALVAGLSWSYGIYRCLRPMRSVVLISWDGVQRSVFQELFDAGSLPFVQSLPHVINMTNNLEFNVGTATRHQHAIMFSGHLVDVTGIRSNEPKNNDSPPARNNGLTIPGGITVFERVRQEFPCARIQGGCGKPTNVGDMLGFPGGQYWLETMGWAPPARDDCLYYNMYGFDIFDDIAGMIQNYEPDMHQADRYPILPRFLEIAENKPPFFYMFHFSDPDHVGHHGNPTNPPVPPNPYGVDSQQYRDAIIACDRATGMICNKLASSNPAIIVTSDHGFGIKPDGTYSVLGFGHGGTPFTFLATNLPIVRTEAFEADVAPTIYDCLGIPYRQWNLYGESLLREGTLKATTPLSPLPETWNQEEDEELIDFEFE